VRNERPEGPPIENVSGFSGLTRGGRNDCDSAGTVAPVVFAEVVCSGKVASERRVRGVVKRAGYLWALFRGLSGWFWATRFVGPDNASSSPQTFVRGGTRRPTRPTPAQDPTRSRGGPRAGQCATISSRSRGNLE